MQQLLLIHFEDFMTAPTVARRKRGVPADPDSLISRLLRMEPFQNLSVIDRVVGSMTVAGMKHYVANDRQALRNNVTSSISAAKRRAKESREYSQEVTHVLTPGGRLYVLSIVTRTA